MPPILWRVQLEYGWTVQVEYHCHFPNLNQEGYLPCVDPQPIWPSQFSIQHLSLPTLGRVQYHPHHQDPQEDHCTVEHPGELRLNGDFYVYHASQEVHAVGVRQQYWHQPVE